MNKNTLDKLSNKDYVGFREDIERELAKKISNHPTVKEIKKQKAELDYIRRSCDDIIKKIGN